MESAPDGRVHDVHSEALAYSCSRDLNRGPVPDGRVQLVELAGGPSVGQEGGGVPAGGGAGRVRNPR